MQSNNKDTSFFIRKTLWKALLFAIVMYNVAAYFIVKGQEIKPLPALILEILIAMGAMSIVSVLTMRSLFANPNIKALQKLPRITKEIIIWATIESIALFGFVLSMLSMNIIYVNYFSIPAILLFLISPPIVCDK